ncbi:MAG: polysaccharide biosynthesis protein [Prevotella sp.]|uniref:nucleoside-diphosphate sugar epimerase/dehydratase n=1 Tax=Prevotella sp. TaxID=59823 RepID=UPI0025F112BD|nr:nucleoside-diphosphate sugar epimerase/dehydratase [Prevotella sp.]MCI7118444.1 polysaccharide biosynthesis protein [Prevotella sp.]
MKLFSSFFNWYFGRNALPYWCIVIFDFLLCFFGALFVMWLRHPLTSLLPHTTELTHTLLAFGVANLIGFRMFHTYSGILRYAQFVDLLRVLYASLFSMVLALLFNYSVLRFGWDDVFFPLTGRKIAIIYIFTAALMGCSRILIRVIFENVLVSKNAQNVLIYGTHAGAISMTNEARSNKPVRFLIEGYIGDSKPHYKERLMGKHIYSTQEDLLEVIQAKNIKAVLVSPLKHDMFLHNRKLQDLFINAGVRIYIAQNAEKWNKNKDYKEKVVMREINIEDLLPRDEIQVDMEKVGVLLRGKKVLITGSAGSIGSEMVRQIAVYKPAEMMLIDQAETPQHDIRLMMMNSYPDIKAETVVTSICKLDRMEKIFSTFRPDYVFHAAAYKHVPMMEDNPSESIQNNVYGTKVIADLSVKYGVKKFVMISTDKAVNPTNVMGCSKRICEIYVQSLDKAIKDGKIKGVTQFVTTRFGNVLGSNGSVIPLFRKQLAAGGPLTVTHPKIIRFFMLIPEACKLVLEAGTHGKGGEIFVFDMGEPVRIADLARRMILLSGAKNVEIKYTGLREGEKLYEEVLNENENTLPSFHKKIRIAMVRSYEYDEAERDVEELCDIAAKYDDMQTVHKMKEIVPEYISKHSRYEVLDKQEDKE